MHLCIFRSGHSVRSGPACRLNLDLCCMAYTPQEASKLLTINKRRSCFWSLPCSLIAGGSERDRECLFDCE